MIEIAAKVRLDAFEKVKKAIDDMVAQLLKEKEDEIKHKDFCVGGLNENEKTTESTERDHSDVKMSIEDLAMTIDGLAKEIETLKAEITELGVQLKRAGEDRELENKEFQIVVADQRATYKLITAALDILKGFYEKAALVQKKSVNARKAEQPAFKPTGSNSNSGGVMGMMEEIIGEAKGMEADAIRAEEDAQKAYE